MAMHQPTVEYFKDGNSHLTRLEWFTRSPTEQVLRFKQETHGHNSSDPHCNPSARPSTVPNPSISPSDTQLPPSNAQHRIQNDSRDAPTGILLENVLIPTKLVPVVKLLKDAEIVKVVNGWNPDGTYRYITVQECYAMIEHLKQELTHDLMRQLHWAVSQILSSMSNPAENQPAASDDDMNSTIASECTTNDTIMSNIEEIAIEDAASKNSPDVDDLVDERSAEGKFTTGDSFERRRVENVFASDDPTELDTAKKDSFKNNPTKTKATKNDSDKTDSTDDIPENNSPTDDKPAGSDLADNDSTKNSFPKNEPAQNSPFGHESNESNPDTNNVTGSESGSTVAPKSIGGAAEHEHKNWRADWWRKEKIQRRVDENLARKNQAEKLRKTQKVQKAQKVQKVQGTYKARKLLMKPMGSKGVCQIGPIS